MPSPFRRPWPKRGTTQKQAGLREGFRSGLEDKTAADLRARGVAFEFEPFKIPYRVPASDHNYTPDFPLGNGIIVETKGRFLAADRAKHLLVRAQYPGLDIRLVFSNPKTPITQGSKTTVAMWAEKHGIKWAAKTVPQSWVEEPGPAEMPLAVIARGPLVPDLQPSRKGTAKRK